MLNPGLIIAASQVAWFSGAGGGGGVTPVQLAAWDPPHAATNHILGVTKTTAEMWEDNADFAGFYGSPYDPAFVVDGVGFIVTDGNFTTAVTTAELWAALDIQNKGELVVLMHYILARASGGAAEIYFELPSLPGFAQSTLYFAALTATPLRQIVHGSDSLTLAPPTGEHKVAMRITPAGTSVSIDGAAVNTTAFATPFNLATHFGIYLGAYTVGDSTNCHHVHFYDPATVVDDAALMALAA